MRKLLILDVVLVHLACMALAVTLWQPEEVKPLGPIRAGSFRLVDQLGAERGRFATTTEGAELVLHSDGGASSVTLRAGQETGQFVLATARGELVFEVVADGGRVRIGSSVSWGELAVDPQGASLELRSTHRTIRLNASDAEEALVIESTSAGAPRIAFSSSSQASALTLEDAEGGFARVSVATNGVELALGPDPATQCWRLSETGPEPCVDAARHSNETGGQP